MIYKYKVAQWDKKVLIATIAVFILFLFSSYKAIHEEDIVTIGWVLSLLWGGLIVFFLFSPRGYALSERHIYILRPVGKIKIHRDSIKSLEIIERAKPHMRTFGSGGLFGWFGIFDFEEGKVNVWATRWEQMVRIETDSKIYLISPANPDDFYQAYYE